MKFHIYSMQYIEKNDIQSLVINILNTNKTKLPQPPCYTQAVTLHITFEDWQYSVTEEFIYYFKI